MGNHLSAIAEEPADTVDDQLESFIFWNCCSDRRLKPGTIIGDAYPEYHLASRFNKIVSVLDTNAAGILCEIDSAMRELLATYVQQHGLYHQFIRYNKSDLTFCYMVFSRYQWNSIKIRPLTKSGARVVNANRPTAPAAGEIASAEYQAYQTEILGDNFDKTAICVSFCNIDIWCCHLGLSEKCRMLQTQMLADIVLREKVSGKKTIIGGDFNCFDVTNTEPILMKQIDILLLIANINWVTGIIPTFYAYPYDLVYKYSPEEKAKYQQLVADHDVDTFRKFCDELADKYKSGSPLDHVFSFDCQQISYELFGTDSMSDHRGIKVCF